VSLKKIVDYHIARLQDKNAEVRLKSIQELRDLGDLHALVPLESVFRTDPDPAVRKAAQEAGRAIYLKSSNE
jgi:HEAT repeat protein